MITPDTPILSPPRATFEACAHYLFVHPSHGEYGPGDIGIITRAYFDVCVLGGIDPLIAIAQLIHETGNLTSWWSQRPRRNPAGIGVTGDTALLKPSTGAWQYDPSIDRWKEGIAFATWADDAIPAHIGRLLAYALRDDQASEAQRALISKALGVRPLPTSYRGAAPTLAGLAGRWAVPGTDYPAKLAAIANTIVGAPVSHLDALDILDLSNEIAALPRVHGCEHLPARDEPEQFVTFHYSGVLYMDRSRATEERRVISEANYQLQKNWARPDQPPVYGDRYMYDFGVLSDGQIVRYNRERIQLWHAGNATANARSWSVHVMLGASQALTAPQRTSIVALFDALRADGAIDRQAVYGHCEWPRVKGAAQPSTTYRLLAGQSECPGRLLHQFVVDYRAGRV